jgi:hypothetical protein
MTANREKAEGIDMDSVCRTLARVLATLEETQYTKDSNDHKERQAEVLTHRDLPDQASEVTTRRANR